MKLEWTDLIRLTEEGVKNINPVSGVYRLSYFDPNRNGKYVYYVGQAEDLNKRLSEHLSGNEKNLCCKGYLQKYNCYFRAAGISKQSDRDGAEVALYNNFKPSCVERIPDVHPIDINFN